MISYLAQRGPDASQEFLFDLEWDELEPSQHLYRLRYCRLRKLSMYILRLLRLRRIWSQVSSLLNTSGRNSIFTEIRTFTFASPRYIGCCRRRRELPSTQGAASWTLGQARSYITRQLRRRAVLFNHLISDHGFQVFRSEIVERRFCFEIRRQVSANGWINWQPVFQRSLYSVREQLPRRRRGQAVSSGH